MAGTMQDRASARRPSPSSWRMAEAEYPPASPAAASWAAPVRETVKISGSLPLCSRARQYSMPSVLLGLDSSAASSAASRAETARCLAAAKLSPWASAAFRSGGRAGLSSAFAARRMAALSPHSLPKASTSNIPVPVSTSMPPRATPSAELTAHGRGSSSTRSAPLRTAASARACRRTRAKSPRWTKSPLMAQMIAVSPPYCRRTACIRNAWP